MINFVKSQPSPICLTSQLASTGDDYKCGDVIERLRTDFKNKCYLCEDKGPTSINVEHFIPHRGDRRLMLDWNNLFFACWHCNNTKSANTDLVDCTDPTINILDVLHFEGSSFPKPHVKVIPLSTDQKIVNTARLLNEIYNGTTTLKISEGVNIKDRLAKELFQFTKYLHEYYYTVGLTQIEKDQVKIEIR